jgi:hypothetical protein
MDCRQVCNSTSYLDGLIWRVMEGVLDLQDSHKSPAATSACDSRDWDGVLPENQTVWQLRAIPKESSKRYTQQSPCLAGKVLQCMLLAHDLYSVHPYPDSLAQFVHDANPGAGICVTIV